MRGVNGVDVGEYEIRELGVGVYVVSEMDGTNEVVAGAEGVATVEEGGMSCEVGTVDAGVKGGSCVAARRGMNLSIGPSLVFGNSLGGILGSDRMKE